MTGKDLRDAIIKNGENFIAGIEAWYFPNGCNVNREDFLNIVLSETRSHVDLYFDKQDKDNARYNELDEKS